jgi:hypothetical protein
VAVPSSWTATLKWWKDLCHFECEEGRPKSVRDKVAGKGQQQNY